LSSLTERPRGRTARLSDSLELVMPAMPAALIGSDAQRSIAAIAAALPPFHQAGFECRLKVGEAQVDLQQGFPLRDQALAPLVRFLAAEPDRGSSWGAVHRLAVEHLERSDAGELAEIWLEPDVIGSGDGPELHLSDLGPSVFAVLGSHDADASLDTAVATVRTLLPGREAADAESVLRRCAGACDAPARISHVGVMLGRDLPALRVHVCGIPLHSFDAHVKRLGWPGDHEELHLLAAILLDHCDELVVCLDVLDGQVMRIGLECFFSQKQGVDPRWPPLLDRLVELGLSSKAKAQALLTWPGALTPLDLPDQWPDDLLVQSLTYAADMLGIVERRLSHIKVTCAPGLPPSAKAYFGYGHVRMAARPVADPARRLPAPAPASTADTAIDAAIGRLLDARNQSGLWRDFFDRGRPRDVERRVNGYASDEWVSAYIATALAGVPRTKARDAARHALARLLARRGGKLAGWGYHALLPPDADTTAWVLRLADAVDTDDRDRLTPARSFVASLTDSSGAVHTYAEEAAGPLAEFLLMDGSYAGWCGAHTCVTAAVAALEPDGPSAGHLLEAQNADGSWSGHWWDDDEYATARAIEALAARPGAGDAVARAIAWSAGRISEDGAVRSHAHAGASPFATALALHGIRAGGLAGDGEARAAAARAEHWLCRHQLADGSWEPSARLRVPAPAAVDPFELPEQTLTYVDEDGLFTTATVLAALSDAGGSRR
jgi:Prenyltransferase and squalene oxidase repeat